MSKIICDVCGTSYAETAAQCPICGCVRPADAAVVSDAADGAAGTYTYVKGGRFSKSNVRKRNKNQQAPVAEEEDEDDYIEPKQDNRGLIITAAILFLAIIAVLLLIFLKFILPTMGPANDPNDETTQSTQALQIPCKDIQLDVPSFNLAEVNEARLIAVTVLPSDSTDEVTFTSSDESVVTVSSEGKVTAVGGGQATITVRCGNIVKTVIVDCTFEDPTTKTTLPESTLVLAETEVIFDTRNATKTIYSGDLMAQITWKSDDITVASVAEGVVTAVGPGETLVHAEYNGQSVSCKIVCTFANDVVDPGDSGITEDTGDMNKTLVIHTQYGKAPYSEDQKSWDISLSDETAIYLYLKDSAGNQVTASWSISGDSCTMSGNKVTPVSNGTSIITATYNGQTYTCIIRVRLPGGQVTT